jgi:OOP family OmpA-OmpF porin
MKKHLLVSFAVLAMSQLTYSQDSQSTNDDKENNSGTFNKWYLEFMVGQAKGFKPYATGHYGGNPSKFFGNAYISSYNIGVRYMFNPNIGLKLSGNYDVFENQKGSESLPFESNQFRLNFEGVVNAMRIFAPEDYEGRFGLLFHGGIQASRMRSELQDLTEWNGGLIIGFTPQYRISNKISILLDVSLLSNYRQHFNWDGSNSDVTNNLVGSMGSLSLGLNFSLGKNNMHGDWAYVENPKDEQIKELEARIGEIETLMNDSDKDGVPDYLDVENNSIPGVVVDTKGRMVDRNNNGVPDELERYVDNSVKEGVANNVSVSDGMVTKLINDGYIAAYFDTNKRQPTNASTENIGFILNYLRNNPDKSVDIIGYADEIGSSEYNNKLSADRANSIKTTLMKAGISENRLNIIGNGSDTSVDKNSELARRLVRKVVFKIK